MAAKTPDSTHRESIGSLTLIKCIFSTANIDDGDTYATGLGSNLYGYWMNASLDCTQGNEGVNISNSSGTLTFHTGEDDVTGELYLLAKA